VAVLTEHQGRGSGRRLIETARAHAELTGLSALKLTTFRDVPWNGPFYARLGFEMLSPSSLGNRLSAILANEAAGGLPRERRCAMRLNLTKGSLK
jgi:N-acetylglutamate synthase-like GNAT family acetyltransferase